MILAPCKIENRIANIRYYMVSSPYNIEYDCFHKILQPRFSILHGLENHVKSEIGIDNRKSAIFDISCDRFAGFWYSVGITRCVGKNSS
jgi:hypothetical protein